MVLGEYLLPDANAETEQRMDEACISNLWSGLHAAEEWSCQSQRETNHSVAFGSAAIAQGDLVM